MSVFETETMAELCVKQGLVEEALAMYRRLAAQAPDAATRGRREARVAALALHPRPTPRPAALAPTARRPTDVDFDDDFDEPTLTLERRGDSLVLAWVLPPDTTTPALQLLLVRRGPAGVETETRTLRLEAPRGSTIVIVTAPAPCSVHAAAGRLDGARFVPLARLRR
jgi:hypothetical protein